MRKWSDICAYRCVIHITGWEVERFLNICKHNDILFTDVIMDKTGVFATISYKAWKTVQKLQEKCQVSCSIVTETAGGVCCQSDGVRRDRFLFISFYLAYRCGGNIYLYRGGNRDVYQ